jgi:hypothetical protein
MVETKNRYMCELFESCGLQAAVAGENRFGFVDDNGI